MKPPVFSHQPVRLATLAVTVAVSLLSARPPSSRAADLTPEQVANILKQLEEIQARVEGNSTERHRGAYDTFLKASQDAKAAFALYLNCSKEVNFVREGRDDSEYRDWEDRQKDRAKNEPRFLESMQKQLAWLALTCRAAETKELKDVFPMILSYVDGLSSLSEMPDQSILQGVGGSVFAQAYHLEDLLRRNESWEEVPFDIAGIYDKTILPHLRNNDVAQLIPAWDRRIEQETRMVTMLAAFEKDGNSRDERRQAQNQQRQMQEGRGQGNQFLKAHDEDDFARETLPGLRWARLKDMYQYVNQVEAMLGLLSFLKENEAHPKAPEWLKEALGLIGGAAETSTLSTPPAVTETPGTTSTTPPAPGATTTGGGTAGGRPAGLEPASGQ
ncbi:MAG: hypothetical protein KDM91_04350 [Verrucomicrobiae bacterium]|nr:hypothetical protein [Verrucomicrobiae bacterium]